MQWTPEIEGFHATLNSIVAPLDDDELILFGCDDVVFFRSFSMQKVENFLHDSPDVTGFSLRLGNDLTGFETARPAFEQRDNVLVWTTDKHKGHWGYPFELMGTVFRAGLVKQILTVGGPFRGPNDFEGIGMRLCSARRVPLHRRVSRAIRGKPAFKGESERVAIGRLAMFDCPNHCAAQDVNIVQTMVDNAIHGTDDHDIDTLKQQYLEGYRLDWQSLDGITPHDCFIGDRFWKMKAPTG